MPLTVAHSHLTGLAAAQNDINVYTVPAGAAGVYRVTYYAIVTLAPGSSGELGGAGFQVGAASDFDGNAVLTQPNPTNYGGSPNPGAALGTVLTDSATISVSAGTTIYYYFGYQSSGAPAMTYDLTVTVEYISPLP